MRDYPNVPCSVCLELIDPGSAFWYPTEQQTFTDYGQPVNIDDLEPLCEDCTLRLLIDRDKPRHALRRPRPADIAETCSHCGGPGPLDQLGLCWHCRIG